MQQQMTEVYESDKLPIHQWIGLRENLQETMVFTVFTIKYRGFQGFLSKETT
jgi:hypothetical protein